MNINKTMGNGRAKWKTALRYKDNHLPELHLETVGNSVDKYLPSIHKALGSLPSAPKLDVVSTFYQFRCLYALNVHMSS